MRNEAIALNLSLIYLVPSRFEGESPFAFRFVLFLSEQSLNKSIELQGFPTPRPFSNIEKILLKYLVIIR